jgi:hypothetical protein
VPLVVISGPLANKPFNGGAAWTRLSWTLGFRQLGWQVLFLEQIAATSCVDAIGLPCAFEDSSNLAFFRDVIHTAGLGGSAALMCDDASRIWGATWRELIDLAGSADLLINISGHLRLEPLLQRFAHKAFLDLDPGFTQVWHANRTAPLPLEDHQWFFTVGENIGTADCSIPTDGIDWQPIRQPVVLDEWPVCDAVAARDRFTTVATWRGPYGPLEHHGATLGLKVHEFRKFIELPLKVRGCFELALDMHSADANDRALLHQNGWRLVDPRAVASTPGAFRQYVQTSAAECSVAQGVYVATHCGWFSDRTVRYLASGKPVLVQDTGFTRNYPTGLGLNCFSTLGQAVDGAETILRQYAAHSRAARSLAEEHFASEKVLGGLLRRVGMA